jgi:hypothetical protein
MVEAIIPPASIRILDLPYRGTMTTMICGDNSSNADETALRFIASGSFLCRQSIADGFLGRFLVFGGS